MTTELLFNIAAITPKKASNMVPKVSIDITLFEIYK